MGMPVETCVAFFRKQIGVVVWKLLFMFVSSRGRVDMTFLRGHSRQQSCSALFSQSSIGKALAAHVQSCSA